MWFAAMYITGKGGQQLIGVASTSNTSVQNEDCTSVEQLMLDNKKLRQQLRRLQRKQALFAYQPEQ